MPRRYAAIGGNPPALRPPQVAPPTFISTSMHVLACSSKHVISGSQSKETQEKLIALRAVCCSALTQLVLNDANAQLIVQVRIL